MSTTARIAASPDTGVAKRPRFRPVPWLIAGFALALLVAAPSIGLLSLTGGSLASPLTLSPVQVNAIHETAILLAGVALLAGSMGLVTAWLVTLYDFPFRRMIEIALVLPLAFPTYLAAFVAVDLLDYFGPAQSLYRVLIGAKSAADYSFPQIRSLPGGILVLSLVLYPYVYVPCRLVFLRSGRNILDAARLLGASGLALFLRVGVPIARPAVAAGLVLALLETLNDIGATEHLGISSFSVAIRDLWLNRSDLPGAARLALMLLAIVALLIAIEWRIVPPRDEAGRGPARPRVIRLSRSRAVVALGASALPVLAGFVLPALFLLSRALLYARQQSTNPEFLRAAASSLALACLVSLLVMAAGAAIAIAIRITPRLGFARPMTTLGYAIPGTVLVLAAFPVLRGFDILADAAGMPLALSGTFAALAYVLTIRFAGIGAAQAGITLSRLPQSIDWAARVHGMRDFRLALSVHLPAMLPGLGIAAILVFIDTIKELPATLLIRPLNFETLATRAYQKASAGTFEHAAIDSLTILALSGIAALALMRDKTE